MVYYSVVAGIASSVVHMLVAAVLTILFIVLSARKSRRRMKDSYPEAVVITRLLNAAVWANDKMVMDTFESRRILMTRIEAAARAIEERMSLRLLSGDKELNKWTQEAYAGIAKGMREIKKEITLPGNASHLEIKNKLNKYLVSALTNDWKSVSNEAGVIRKTALQRAWLFFRVRLMPGLALVGIFWLLTITGIDKLVPGFQTILFPVLIIATAIIVLGAFIPGLEEKLAIFKDLSALHKKPSA
jgi:cytochrome bd-type quinol oxidase subunit 1